jgi:hypothetical protein
MDGDSVPVFFSIWLILSCCLPYIDKAAYLVPSIADSTAAKAKERTVIMNEKHKIILGAFYNPRYGISPTATRGAVESHAKKHKLSGADYTQALESAIAEGLVAAMSDASLTIRNAGRQMLPRR